MAFFGLFSSSRALRVTDAGITPVPEAQRIHPAQQFQRTWTIATGTNVAESHRLTKLALKTPGLTIVRVRPELRRDDATAVARVVVSSDATQHLDRVALAIKHKTELRVAYKNTEGPPPLGVLVVEIELAHASLNDEIKASGGGDVVVEHGAVFTRHADACVALVALDRSRLFVSSDDDTSDLTVQHFRVASVSGGSVFVSVSGALRVREELACIVLGDGRVAVHAPRVETHELIVGVVGDHGTAQLRTSAGGDIAPVKAEAVVIGTGSILVQASPSSRAHDTPVACTRMKVEMTGAGSADVAAIAARTVDVSAKHGARAVVQAHETLSLECEGPATSVECVGTLPPRVAPALAHIPPERLRVTPHEHRVWMASEPTPDAPTPLVLFTTPRVLLTKKVGVRETLRPLWAAMQSHTSTRASSATPAWVRVIGDVTGGGKSV